MAADAGGAAANACQQLQQDILARFGFAVKAAWLQQIVTQLQLEHVGFAQQPRNMQLQLLLEQLLLADFRQAGAGGMLPPNVKVSKQPAQQLEQHSWRWMFGAAADIIFFIRCTGGCVGSCAVCHTVLALECTTPTDACLLVADAAGQLACSTCCARCFAAAGSAPADPSGQVSAAG